jgi:hypothetical protein
METDKVFQCRIKLAVEREAKNLCSAITPEAQACGAGLFDIVGAGPLISTPSEINYLVMSVRLSIESSSLK